MDQLRDQLSEMRVQWIKDFQKPINAKAVFTLDTWVPTQNSDALRHFALQRPKCPDSGLSSWKKACSYKCPARIVV